MATNMTDEDLSTILGEPPRKRRAAALAAQKNWQILSKDPEEDVITEDDIIVISQKQSYVKTVQSIPNQITYSSVKRTAIPSTLIIDLNKNKKNINETDVDYRPNEELVRPYGMRAKKTFPTPLRNITINNTKIGQNLNQNVIRLKGQEVVRIESDRSNRLIVRSNASQYQKPIEVKLHPNEPQDFPIVSGNVEEIVGTYDVIPEEYKDKPIDDSFDELDLNLFLICESEDIPPVKTTDLNESDDCIEIIEVIPKTTVKTPVPLKLKTFINPKNKPLNGRFDSVIGCLEMECESVDDEFTDSLCFDCEEDILNVNQWNRSAEEHKQYNKYSKTVGSTKNVKFLPEPEVTEPVGVISKTVSETTKVITTPTPTPLARTRQQTIRLSQSIRAPIPSTVNTNRVNILRQQRPQQIVTTMPSLPVQNPTLNGLPITLLPVSTSTPLILAPATQSLMTPTGLAPLQVLLSHSGPNNQPTYVMLPRSNAGAIPGMSAPNIYISNPNPIFPTNIITNSSPNIRLVNQSQPRYRGTPNPSRLRLPTNFRAPAPTVRQPNVSYGSVNRFSSPDIQIVSEPPNQTNVSSRTDPIFDCLTVLKGAPNSVKKINMRTVLTIKPLPFSWPSNIDDLISSLIKLDNALMKEKFKESPIAWMVSAYLIVPPKCKNCPKGVCNQVNKSHNTKNEYWKCNNQRCGTAYLIDRPKVFCGPKFDIPVSKLLFIIYYWSIQVDVEDLIKTGQIEMGTEKIFNVWQQLQKVCSSALRSKDSKLGSGQRHVEIASIQVGRFHILGALELVSHRVKACVVPISAIVQQNGKQAILQPFIQWLEKGTTVRTCETKFTALRDLGFKVTLLSKNEFLSSNKDLSLKTIGGYLIHHLQRFFKDFDLTTLSMDIMSNILDELLWRERYGTNPFAAFYNIIKHIGEQCGLRKADSNMSAVNMSALIQTRTPTSSQINISSNISAPVRPPVRPQTNASYSQLLNDSNSVFVDEYYYSSLKLKTNSSKSGAEEETPKDSIQCHLCQMFYNNILVVKHLLEHLEKERGGRVRKGDNNESECKHCLRFFSNRTLHMHEELSNLKMVPYSCRVCALPFYARQPFIQHMKTSHFSGEMPYYCDICCYRSSFQKNLLDHFEDSHSNISQIMCPFCIRIFDLNKFKNLSQFVYRHLQSHYAVASVYDCDNCVLTFVSKPDLKDHCFKAHNPSTFYDEKFEIIPFVVSEEDKSLCIRAREQELFTPFLPNFGDNTTNAVISEDNDFSCEMSCEPNIDDLLSIEPECHISLTEGNTPFENYILPVDCDYTNAQLIQMMAKTLGVFTKAEHKEEEMEVQVEGVEPIVEGVKPIDEYEKGVEEHKVEETAEESKPKVEERVDPMIATEKIGVCFECKTLLSIDHFISKSVCNECHFTTHCKTAFAQHMSGAHSSAPELFNQISVFKPFARLMSYNNVCRDCDFTTTDGNQMAIHMFVSKHLNLICKPLVPKTDQLL